MLELNVQLLGSLILYLSQLPTVRKMLTITVCSILARGKKKKIVKSLIPILLLLKLKAAALIPIALGALALLALKALVIGKIALIVSAIIGLQKLFANKHHQSYEVVAHPVHSYGHEEHHDHHGWARSAGSDLAYNAYKPSE